VCDEHVSVITNEDWKVAYGDYDWRKNFFKFDTGDHAYQTFYANAIREVGERKKPHDFILPFWGAGTRPVCDAHQDLICVEPGIGYAGGHWAKYKVFESHAIYHAFYNLDAVGSCKQNWYDIVIPNYFDPDDFEFRTKKEDYFLFLGRVYDGKGIHAAIQVTRELGVKLVVAGQNNLKDCGYETVPDHVTEVGYADRQKRKELMAGAKGAFVCSLYVEPFGGVQVEMLMSGTPTITTDWGAFTENNIHGVTGYRCHTFDEMCWAASNIDTINPYDCRAYAMNFALEKVAVMYEEYFQNILNIYTGNGWYERNPERLSLDYMSKPLEYDYDFVEIGPGNCDYLQGRGIYVEPMSELLASIQNPDGIKVNAAITHNKKGEMGDMYYLPGSRGWQVGCTSLYTPHPTLDTKLQQTRPVMVMDIGELWTKHSIRTVQHLKLCTQGMDCVILEGLYEHLKSRQKWYYPVKISFQTNELYDPKNISRIFEIFSTLGYEQCGRGTMILSGTYYSKYLCISTHVDYCKPLRMLMESLRESKFSHYDDVIICVAGHDKDIIPTKGDDGVTFIYTTQNLYEFTAPMLLAHYKIHDRPVMFIHDTCTVHKQFDTIYTSLKINYNTTYYYGITGGSGTESNIVCVSGDQISNYSSLNGTTLSKPEAVQLEFTGYLGMYGTRTCMGTRDVMGRRDLYETGHDRVMVYYPAFGVYKSFCTEASGDISGNYNTFPPVWSDTKDLYVGMTPPPDATGIAVHHDNIPPSKNLVRIKTSSYSIDDICRAFSLDGTQTLHVNDYTILETMKNYKPQTIDIPQKVAIFCDTKHAFGRIHRDIQSLVGIHKCDYFDWSRPDEYQKLFKNLKYYSKIITNSDIFVNGHKAIDMSNQEVLSKLFVVIHCPVFDNVVFGEKIPQQFIGKGIFIGGVSRETCDNITKTYGIENPPYLPCGANKNVFNVSFSPATIKRIGFVGIKQHGTEYSKIKRPHMFEEICDNAGCEAVFIHGISDPSKLYENIDMVICTSTFEGNPLGVFEGAMSGVPFISTRVGNTVELDTVKHFDTVEEAVNIIKNFKENQNEFVEYRDTICKEVRDKFEWSILYEKYWKPHLN
jgi:glycosyltransferase involved in cell wall biosynthesis